MAKTSRNRTTVTTGGKVMNRSLRKVAIIGIIIVMLFSLVGTSLFLAFCPDKGSSAKSIATITSPDTQTVVNPTLPSIGIRDQSISMKPYVTAVAGYDTWKSFGSDGTSKITTAVVDALEQGYERIGVVSDLESYPKAEMNSISGKQFENVELTFFVPNSVDQNWLNTYIKTFKGALDPSNCTLKFVDMSGNTISVLYNNFTSKTAASNPTTVTVTSSYKEGNSVPRSVVVIGLEALFLIVMALIIALLALCGRCCCGFVGTTTVSDAPEGVTRALTAESIALDGSGSVTYAYDRFLKWAKNAGIKQVFRFATDVQKMDLSDAAKMQAGGTTAGYGCLSTMYSAGYRTVTVVSDMAFNDDSSLADGVFFDKIYFVGENLVESQVEHLKQFCKEFEVVSI